MGLYEGLVLPDVADAADLLRPVYDRTGGVDGYVSLEVNPKLAYDTDATISEARRLFKELSRPNVFIKVPATDEGIPAIEMLIGEGINVNVTLIFSIAMYESVMSAYITGLNRLKAAGGDPSDQRSHSQSGRIQICLIQNGKRLRAIPGAVTGEQSLAVIAARPRQLRPASCIVTNREGIFEVGHRLIELTQRCG